MILSNHRIAELFKESHISDWRVQKGVFQAVRMEKNMMGLLISLIIVVAISNIVTSLSLMVVDKQGEIAILQTQGLTKSQVRSVFIYQGLLVGFVGTFARCYFRCFSHLELNRDCKCGKSTRCFFTDRIILCSNDFCRWIFLVAFFTFYTLSRLSSCESRTCRCLAIRISF